MATYTESGGTGETAMDQAQAVAVMREKHEICCGLFHGFDRAAWIDGTPAARLGLLPAAQEHVLAQDNGKARCLKAVRVLGDETLRGIARELVETVRNNVTIDWTRRENVRANLRRRVRRILRQHGYPPDKQEKATRTVLEQAEMLSAGWAA